MDICPHLAVQMLYFPPERLKVVNSCCLQKRKLRCKWFLVWIDTKLKLCLINISYNFHCKLGERLIPWEFSIFPSLNNFWLLKSLSRRLKFPLFLLLNYQSWVVYLDSRKLWMVGCLSRTAKSGDRNKVSISGNLDWSFHDNNYPILYMKELGIRP